MKPLIDALNKAGNLGQTVEQLTPAQKAQLVADVAAHGDAAWGELVFRKANQQCSHCHSSAGGGGQVGPDLVSIGASAPLDYLLDSLLEPSKKIKEGYHTTVVTTDSGQVISGLLVRKTESELLLRDATGKEITIPSKDVESQTISPNSLMPIGQVNALRRDELIDLVRFLSELGKEGPYQVSKARLVRNWKVLDVNKLDKAQSLDGKGTVLAIDDDPALVWHSATSTVAGLLPLEDLPAVNRWNQQLFSFARFSIEVPESGQLRLRWNDASGLELWAGKNPLKVAANMVLELPPGVHTISVAIDQKQRKLPLRVELLGTSGPPGSQ
jgi:putative heme-binding domain-containing protein